MVDSRQLSEHFGASPRLLPYLAELLADFSELGSDPELVVSWLADRGIDRASRVLDLGCGKGAASLAACQRLGCEAHGVDAYAPFVAEARRLARELGLADRCEFQVGDLAAAVEHALDYDAVLLLSVGWPFGSIEDSVGILRRCVPPGGVIIVDDAYRLASSALDFPGYEGLLSRDDTLSGLVAHGDSIVAEHLVSADALKTQNQRYQTWIETRGRDLAARKPELAADITAYVDKERQECALLERDVQCATWMIERASPQ